LSAVYFPVNISSAVILPQNKPAENAQITHYRLLSSC